MKLSFNCRLIETSIRPYAVRDDGDTGDDYNAGDDGSCIIIIMMIAMRMIMIGLLMRGWL